MTDRHTDIITIEKLRCIKRRNKVQKTFVKNGYRMYVDILTRENLSLIKLVIMNIIYWSVRSTSKREGAVVKWLDGEYCYFR